MMFSELLNYFFTHPALAKIPNSSSGLDQIKSEYATLSLAVHGSTPNFRMTDSASQVLIWDPDKIKLNKWATRERKVIEGISLLIVYLFKNRLQGARLRHVREMLSFAVSKPRKKSLSNIAKVNI